MPICLYTIQCIDVMLHRVSLYMKNFFFLEVFPCLCLCLSVRLSHCQHVLRGCQHRINGDADDNCQSTVNIGKSASEKDGLAEFCNFVAKISKNGDPYPPPIPLFMKSL